jgi:peptidoglycan/LPS O-acetylase OafA/YrhL
MKFGLVYNAFQFILMEGILSLGLVMVMAYISYHFYERPFLMLKNRFTHIKKQE